MQKLILKSSQRDKAGNETVKNVVLINKEVSEITSVNISSADKPIENGRLTLGEGESAVLRVFGLLQTVKKIDITDMDAMSLEIIGGTSAELDGTKVISGLSGQTLIRAGFALGGNDFLYDGIVVETADKRLIYSALEDVIAGSKTNNKQRIYGRKLE